MCRTGTGRDGVQGIQVGWADLYPPERDCQWVDITGVSEGDYILEVSVNPERLIPELARAYSLAGADVIVYPTAIGSEPHMPGVDTQPMWRQMISANGLANSTFMIAINRIGTEGPLTFYGSSFISDPYGRIVVEAPRDRPAVLIADLDLGQRDDALTFGLMYTRRPDRYGRLHAATELGRPD